jgi:hypothetical protein
MHHRGSCGRSHCRRVALHHRDQFGRPAQLRERAILGPDHQHLPDTAAGARLRAWTVLERVVECLSTAGSALTRSGSTRLD